MRSEATGHQCRKCHKFFSQKSSLTRHAKRCLLDLAPPSRQKSCRHCASAKVRCSLARPKCSRCDSRNIECVYATPAHEATPSESDDSASDNASNQPHSPKDVPTPDLLGPDVEPLLMGNVSSIHAVENAFSARFPTNAFSSIRHHAMVPQPGAGRCTSGPICRHTMTTIIRVQRSWVGMMARKEHLPPIIHNRQLAHGIPLEIMGFYLFAKILDAATKDNIAQINRIALREITYLGDKVRSHAEPATLLIDLQCYILYAVILFFPKGPSAIDHAAEQKIWVKLQEMTYALAQTGLSLPAEDRGETPSWEEWTCVEAKRRAIVSVYQMGWAWSIKNSYPAFHCHELGFIEAPSPKAMWEATSEDEWRKAYATRRKKWGSEWRFYMKELLEVAHNQPDLNWRVEMWLEDVDAFGMLLMSEVGATVDERESCTYCTAGSVDKDNG